jgi:hypothetical protein
MAETTNPATEVAAPSIDDRISGFLGLSDEPEAPEPKGGDEPTPDVPADELAPEDIEAEGEAPPPEEDGLELNHNGEVKRVSKEEARKLAQMGLDATQKWQAAADTQRANQEYRAALDAKLQITPQIVDAAAGVKSYEAALQPYANVDWVQLAQSDPIAYSQHRAQFDQLRDGFQQASGRLQQAFGAAQQIEQRISQQELHAQGQRVMEALPEWKDPQRMASDQGRIRKYLIAEGITDQEINTLADARMVLIARKAMLYDQAINAKKSKGTQTAPSALRPGAAPVRSNRQTQIVEATKQLHQAKDPQRRKALFDDVLARKMGFK